MSEEPEREDKPEGSHRLLQPNLGSDIPHHFAILYSLEVSQQAIPNTRGEDCTTAWRPGDRDHWEPFQKWPAVAFSRTAHKNLIVEIIMFKRKGWELRATDLRWESWYPSDILQGSFTLRSCLHGWVMSYLSLSAACHFDLPQDTRTFPWTLRMGEECPSLKTRRPLRPKAMFYFPLFPHGRKVMGTWCLLLFSG